MHNIIKGGKRIAVFIFIILILGTTVSCGSNRRKNSAVKQSSVSWNREGLPVVNEPLSIEVGVLTKISESEYAKSDYRIFDELEQKTGIHIDWKLIPESNQTAKIVLMFVSGTYPEAFYGMWNSPQDWQRMIDQGFIIPLDPYIEDGLMPNLSKKIDEYPGLLNDLKMSDGHIYSLPRYNDAGNHGDVQAVHILNRKWMETLNLETPTNLRELYDVLVAFRDQDPNGNGKQDEIPMSAVWSDNHFGLWQLFGSFGIHDNVWEHFMVRDGKVISPNTQEEYREAILYIRKLYEEELLDLEFFSQNLDMYESKVRNEQVGFYNFWPAHWARTEEELEKVKAQSLPIPPLRGLNGEPPIWPTFPIKTWGGLEITNKCENPEVLLRWADMFYNDDYGIQMKYGAVGQGLEKIGDKYKDKILPEGQGSENVTFMQGPRAVNEKILIQSAYVEYENEVFDMYTPYKIPERFGSYAYTREDARRLSSIYTDIKKFIDNKQIAWITGESDIDEEWDWYLEELNKMGIEELFGLYQRYYNQNNK